MILSIFSGVQVTSRFVVVIFGGTSRDSADGTSVVCDVVAEEHALSSNTAIPVDFAIGRKGSCGCGYYAHAGDDDFGCWF
jgi:hypothetical protein